MCSACQALILNSICTSESIRIHFYSSESIWFHRNQSESIFINPINLNLSEHLIPTESIRINMNAFASLWMHLNQSLFIRINLNASESIFIHQNQSECIWINPNKFKNAAKRPAVNICILISIQNSLHWSFQCSGWIHRFNQLHRFNAGFEIKMTDSVPHNCRRQSRPAWDLFMILFVRRF